MQHDTSELVFTAATHGSSPNKWCGPTALSAVTGKTTDEITLMIVDFRKSTGSKMELDPAKVSSTTMREASHVLSQLGFKQTEYQTILGYKTVWHDGHYNSGTWVDGRYQRHSIKPTMVKWIKDQPSGVYLIRVGGKSKGHFLAVKKEGKNVWVCDAAATVGSMILLGSKFAYNRGRVTHFIRVVK